KYKSFYPLFLQFVNNKGFAGFAVIIHNFAELYMLRIIWFGRDYDSYKLIAVVVLYVFLMTTFLIFLPINLLYLVAMVQGATLDYLFCITCPLIAWEIRCRYRHHTDWLLASIAAMIHILSIQPLFIGLAIGNGRVTGIPVLGLFPTFLLYIYFAGRETGHLGFIGPSFKQTLKYRTYVELLKHVLAIRTYIENHKCTEQSEKETETETEAGINAEIEAEIATISSMQNSKRINKPKSQITIDCDDDANTSDSDQQLLKSKKKCKSGTKTSGKNVCETADKLADIGVKQYFGLSDFKVVAVFKTAFVLALINALIIWRLPCSNPICQT
ncbi:hypothetical protein RFI_21631, partial [Reticulomyxa filosa]